MNKRIALLSATMTLAVLGLATTLALPASSYSPNSRAQMAGIAPPLASYLSPAEVIAPSQHLAPFYNRSYWYKRMSTVGMFDIYASWQPTAGVGRYQVYRGQSLEIDTSVAPTGCSRKDIAMIDREWQKVGTVTIPTYGMGYIWRTNTTHSAMEEFMLLPAGAACGSAAALPLAQVCGDGVLGEGEICTKDKIVSLMDINKNGTIDFGEPSLAHGYLVDAINEAFAKAGSTSDLRFDVDQNGYLSPSDALALINAINADENLRGMVADFAKMDTNDDRSIAPAEFVAFTVAVHKGEYTLANTGATTEQYKMALGLQQAVNAFSATLDQNGDREVNAADALLFIQSTRTAQDTLTRINNYNAYTAAYKKIRGW